MALNDFEYVDSLDSDDDQEITSTNGKIVNKYLASKNKLDYAISDAMDASYNFGHLVGQQDTKDAIIEWIKENRRTFEIDEGVEFYRDSFNSEDLIKFIEGLGNE